MRLALAEAHVILNRELSDSSVELVESDEGGVNTWESDAKSDLAEWVDDEDLLDINEGMLDSENDEVEELEGDELVQNLEEDEGRKRQRMRSYFDVLMSRRRMRDWNDIERTRIGGYNGLSDRTKRYHRQKAREQEEDDAKTRKRYVKDLLCSLHWQRILVDCLVSIVALQHRFARFSRRRLETRAGHPGQMCDRRVIVVVAGTITLSRLTAMTCDLESRSECSAFFV